MTKADVFNQGKQNKLYRIAQKYFEECKYLQIHKVTGDSFILKANFFVDSVILVIKPLCILIYTTKNEQILSC